MSKTYTRRWRGFTPEQVSERMKMIAQNRFKSKRAAKKHSRMMVAARRVK